MKIIALTGGIGAGKSQVLKAFEELGALVIDADKISREIMQKGAIAYKNVVAEFGTEILDNDKEINRKALASIVFNDEKKLARLNEITHTLIYKEIEERIKEANNNFVCVEIPLLFAVECPFKIDANILVIAPVEKRIERVILRDNSTKEQVLERIKRQMSDEEMIPLADFVIENNSDEKVLKDKIIGIYNQVFENN